MSLSDDLERLWRTLMDNVAVQRSELFELKYLAANSEATAESMRSTCSIAIRRW
jgi:hypothetical protein